MAGLKCWFFMVDRSNSGVLDRVVWLSVEVGLELYAEKSVVLPFFTGYVSRGLLLHVVRTVDPSASGLLHELNVSKPYSVKVCDAETKSQ